MGAQSHPQCRQFRQILERPHDRPICCRNLERQALSGVVKENQSMTISPLAGKPAPKEMLVDLVRLEREYFARRPDLDDPEQLVSFGTSGHRGSPFRGSFTEAHILAITSHAARINRERCRPSARPHCVLPPLPSGKFLAERSGARHGKRTPGLHNSEWRRESSSPSLQGPLLLQRPRKGCFASARDGDAGSEAGRSAALAPPVVAARIGTRSNIKR